MIAEAKRRGLWQAPAACGSAEANLSQYQADPVGYATDVLHVTLTPDQREMLESVRDNRYTAVKASHAIGKTFLASVAANWWYDCWDAHIVYVTAPNWSQALGLTFKSVKTLRRKNSLPGDILDSGLVRDADKHREGAHFIKALNAETGEGFQGEHSAPILIIKEEAVGVPSYIWDAAGGLMTHPACRTLAIANPTDEATKFGQACENPGYHVLSISALNHPNIVAELHGAPPPFPDAVRLQWLYEMLESECERVAAPTEDAFTWWALPDIQGALQGRPLRPNAEQWHYLPTAYFQGRVLGEFPTQADQQVIPRGWLRGQPVLEPAREDFPELGCDVARFGDDRTTIADRQGPCAFHLDVLRKLDNEAVIVQLRDSAKRAAARVGGEPKKVPIKIDVTGGLGTGPFDRLKGEGYAVHAVNSSNKARNEEQYPNRRSELWFDSRDRAKQKRLDLSRLPKDVREKLIRELSSPKYAIKSGRKTVEDKAEMKKRLGASPDLADGINLAYSAERQFSIPTFGALTRQTQ